MKNGTSEPSSSAYDISWFLGMFRLNILSIANKVQAALELPPPSPAPIGIFL